jgi:hypothetical protein
MADDPLYISAMEALWANAGKRQPTPAQTDADEMTAEQRRLRDAKNKIKLERSLPPAPRPAVPRETYISSMFIQRKEIEELRRARRIQKEPLTWGTVVGADKYFSATPITQLNQSKPIRDHPERHPVLTSYFHGQSRFQTCKFEFIIK